MDNAPEEITPEMAQKLIESVVQLDLVSPDDDIQSQIREALEPPRVANKPDIDMLDDAIAVVEDHGTVFLPQRGEGVIIQYPQAWRDTTYYIVHNIDYESGIVWLWNPQRKQFAGSNFIEASKYGLVFKIPPEGASELRMAIELGRRRRGRPKKNIVRRVIADADKGPSRKRGRPKGSKNRPKDVIRAERETLMADRSARANERKRRRLLKQR